MSLNRVILQGRLTTDPELRTTQSDVAVANATIAVDRNYKDKGTGEKETDFFNLTAWRGTAEFMAKYFHKGEMMVVDGTLQNSKYTDKDGNKRVSTQVIVESCFFCGSVKPKETGNGEGSSRNESYQLPNISAENFTDIEDGEGDVLPF